MPSKKQRAKGQKLDNYEGEIYVSKMGVSKNILEFGLQYALNVGGEWNGHCWCERNGAIFDPTPLPRDYPEIRKLDGTVERYYKKYPEHIANRILENKEQYRNECRISGLLNNYSPWGDFDTEEEYDADILANPKPFMCWQNCRAYCNANPEWTLCVGAFGFRVDYIPRNSPAGIKKEIKKYKSQKRLNFISLDYGF